MNYDEMSGLLLSDEALSVDQALVIFDYFKEYPEAYKALLDEDGGAVRLKKYVRFDKDSKSHVFETTKCKVIAPKIFYKFLKTGDPDVELFLWEIILENIIDDDENQSDVFAWPYMHKSIINIMSVDLIAQIILGFHFVFNLENDERGYVFETLLNKLEDTELKEYLAISCFNLYGWVMQNAMVNSFYRAQQMLYANHCFEAIYDSNNQVVTEAHMRKFIIKYFYDVNIETPELGKILQFDAAKRCN
jgi:hypothetical protein